MSTTTTTTTTTPAEALGLYSPEVLTSWSLADVPEDHRERVASMIPPRLLPRMSMCRAPSPGYVT